jgi:replication initiation and membrane attachment protein DnaB
MRNNSITQIKQKTKEVFKYKAQKRQTRNVSTGHGYPNISLFRQYMDRQTASRTVGQVYSGNVYTIISPKKWGPKNLSSALMTLTIT